MIDEKIKKILEQFKINPAKALWDCHGTQIMYHRYIEEIGASAGVLMKVPPLLNVMQN